MLSRLNSNFATQRFVSISKMVWILNNFCFDFLFAVWYSLISYSVILFYINVIATLIDINNYKHWVSLFTIRLFDYGYRKVERHVIDATKTTRYFYKNRIRTKEKGIILLFFICSLGFCSSKR